MNMTSRRAIHTQPIRLGGRHICIYDIDIDILNKMCVYCYMYVF